MISKDIYELLLLGVFAATRDESVLHMLNMYIAVI